MSEPVFRWGILGAAGIARKNWKAISLTGNATVAGVASRDPERARHFIDECQAEAPMPTRPVAFATYADLLASDVDGVYIPLPTGLRKRWVIRAAEAGKHVIGEKPCASNAADLRQMLDACRRSGVQYMDGVMFMHSRRLDALRRALDDTGEFGETKRLVSSFTFREAPEFFATNIRTHASLEPLGSLGDLGWYCIRFFLWALDYRVPLEVNGRILADATRPDSDARVPTEFVGEMRFAGAVSAGFFCSFLTETEQWVAITGTHGRIVVSDFGTAVRGDGGGLRGPSSRLPCPWMRNPTRARDPACHGHRTQPRRRHRPGDRDVSDLRRPRPRRQSRSAVGRGGVEDPTRGGRLA